MEMLRAYLVYIFVFVVLAGGLWGVLALGASLQAPQDFAGEWDVRWETPSPSGKGSPSRMRVRQSGRFWTISFDETPALSLKMVEGTALGQGDPRLPLARLIGSGHRMVIRQAELRGAVRVELTAGQRGYRGIAQRLASMPTRTASSPLSSGEHARR